MLLSSVVAHPFAPHTGSWWIVEPSISIGVLCLTLAYLLAIGPLRRRFGWSGHVDRKQTAFFLGAMLIIFVSLQGPLHELSDYYSFSMHMVQHLLVTLIMPPLLLKGIPDWLLRPALERPLVFRLARFVTSPFVAFGLFNVVFALWHVPGFYQLALGNPRIHALEHVLFMGTAVLTWWPVFSPTPLLPRLSEPAQMFYLFCQSVIPTILGALITFADIILYPFYAAAPRVIGLSALDDQQGAGLLMWLGGASIVLFVLTLRFFSWMERDDDEPLESVQLQTQSEPRP
jgi:putative membrane protein